MNEKKRRDITLGEMQDECIRRNNDGKTCAGCDYSFVCPVALGKEMCPKLWFLIDPPRFNEQQMALLRGILGIGCVTITRTQDDAYRCLDKYGKFSFHLDALDLKIGETLDLAELLGKDGAK